MQFQDSDIERLAKLSRLSFSQSDIERFRDQLNTIVSYVEQITALDLRESPPKAGANVMRKDSVTKSSAKPKELLASSPKVEEGHISVLAVNKHGVEEPQ